MKNTKLTPAEIGERAAKAEAADRVRLDDALQAARLIVSSLEKAASIKERLSFVKDQQSWAATFERKFAIEFKNAIEADRQLGDLLRVIRF